MTKEEIKKALLDGKKLRCPEWGVGEFIYFDFETLCVMDEKKIHNMLYYANYEIYEEPILDTSGNELEKNDKGRVMNNEEAKKALLDGKRVRWVYGKPGVYIYFDMDNMKVMQKEGDKIEEDSIDSYGDAYFELYEPLTDTHGNDLKKNDICLFYDNPDEYKVVGIFRKYKDQHYYAYSVLGVQEEAKYLYCKKINLEELN